FATIRVFYSPVFSEILDFHVRLTAPDGKTHDYSRADAEDLLAIAGFELYSDNRFLRLAIREAAPGSVIEYRYTRRFHEPKLFQFSQGFGGDEPTREVRLEVIHPRSWSIAHLARRL